jgi:hypothetical protein
MAKKTGGPNKSAAIRDYVQANPDAKPKEIVDQLKAQGVVVTPAFVSTIKSKLLSGDAPATSGRKKASTKRGAKGAKRKAATRRGAKAAAPARAAGGSSAVNTVSIDSVVLAKKLAEQLGGVDNARAALSALEKITG